MNASAAVILLALLPCVGNASDWVSVGTSANVEMFLDLESVSRVDGAHHKAWARYDYYSPQKTVEFNPKQYMSIKELDYFQCAEKQSAIAQVIMYAGTKGSGETVGSRSYSPSMLNYEEVAPDSLGEVLLKSACLWARTVIERKK